MPATNFLSVDIVSDVVCPWCIIGYKQLQRAVDMMGDRIEIGVRWHPFQLAPNLPPEGQDMRDYVRERYGATPEQSRGNRARLVEIGTSLGIAFTFGDDSRIYNTHRAHELLVWAGEEGAQTALKMALFEAYFTRGENVSETDVLLNAAECAGLDRDAARAVLEDGRYADSVDAEVAHWQDQNVTGVPAFIVNGKFMVPGAQDAETWVRLIERVLQKEAARQTSAPFLEGAKQGLCLQNWRMARWGYSRIALAPSMFRSVPLVKLESSQERKMIAFATSSGVPTRPIGCAEAIAISISSTVAPPALR